LKKIIIIVLINIILFVSIGCSNQKQTVVVYTSVDRVYSEIIFKDFEKKTGIKVLPVYDVEANKTTGLVKRLIVEKNSPKCDVFWNGEIINTIKLKKEGILAVYKSKNTINLPKNYIDKDNMWTAFGGRTRVFLINNEKIDIVDYPSTFIDIYKSNDENKKYISNPVFGTSSTHAVMMYTLLGDKEAYKLFYNMANSDVNIVAGNSYVRDLVLATKNSYGITDTDDAIIALEKSNKIDVAFLDQKDNEKGTLVIPNSVSIIKNCINSYNGEIFIDYLLEENTILKLEKLGWIQIIIDEQIKVSEKLKPYLHNKSLKIMDIDYDLIEEHSKQCYIDMKNLFLK